MNKLFFIIFKNKVLFKQIFSYVHRIHRYILRVKVVKWNKLLNNLNLLAYYNYLKEIKQHHNNSIDKHLFEENDKLVVYITRGDSLDVLQYIIEQHPLLLNFNTQIKTYHHAQKKTIKTDLLFYSVKYNSLKIFNYLESFTNNNDNNKNKKRKTSILSSPSSSLSTTNEIKWDYYHAISIVPLSGNIELFLHLFDKLDIRNIILKNTNNNNEYTNIINFIINSTEYGRSEMLNYIFSLFESDRHILDDILINHSPTIFARIIKNGHLFIIKQYFNNNFIEIQNKLQTFDLISICVTYNQFEMMKYIYENKLGRSHSFRIIDNAIKKGNLEMIKLLHNRNESCTFNAMDNAALMGYFEIVKWLHENRTEGCTTYAMDNAARSGHLEIVKWLHENRTEGCTVNAMINAAKNGYLEIVKWLHENRTEGCTTRAMDMASLFKKKRHFEIIKWLHENRTEGCTARAMNYAAKNGYLKIIKWFHENRTEGCTTDAMDRAAENGHLIIVKWLHKHRTEGCTTDAMDKAAKNGHLEIIKWLQENRNEGYTTDAIQNAASNGHLDIVELLQENRTEGCSSDEIESAEENGH